nr:hypothetical protein [Tanacetum cinerariifolium]
FVVEAVLGSDDGRLGGSGSGRWI